MSEKQPSSEFPQCADENRRIWETNAAWWDDRIGDGNDFQCLLIEPATERLLRPGPGDAILDVACGAGRFARRMAELGARVTALDHSAKFIERAKARTSPSAGIEFHVADAGKPEAFLALGLARFDKAVCTMGLMDMPEIQPLMGALRQMLKPRGIFVFSVTHPCFNAAGIQRFCEMDEEEEGRHVTRTGVKVSAYLQPFARKTEGIIGQPEPQFYFHRPLQVLLDAGFREGFVVDGLAEPGLPRLEETRPGVRWDDMPEIPPVLVARMRLAEDRADPARVTRTRR